MADTELTAYRKDLQNERWQVRYLCLKRLGSSDLSKEQILDLLLGVIEDPQPAIRRQLAVSVGELGDEGGLGILLPLLSDADEWVRIRAVHALASIGSPSAREPLLSLLGTETDSRVLATLVKDLGRFKDKRDVSKLLSFLEHPDVRVRANAVEGLGAFTGDPALVDCLKPLLSDGNCRIRANTARILYGTLPEEARRTLQEMVESADVLARASGAYILGRIGRPELLTLLYALLGDEEWLVRRNVVEALVTFGQSIQPKMIELTMHSDPHIRAVACKVLGEIGDEVAYRKLFDCLADPIGEVRLRCEEALDRLEERLDLQEE